MSNPPLAHMSDQVGFTVIGADWCGFTKKIHAELDASELTLDIDYHKIECGKENPQHEACKHVLGYPAVVSGGESTAAQQCQEGKAEAGYRPLGDHPIISKHPHFGGGGKGKGKGRKGKGGKGKVTVVGTGWCGFTTKLIDELKQHNMEHDFVDCAQNKTHLLCDGLQGYPVTYPGEKEVALENKRKGIEVVGYKPATTLHDSF